MERKGAVRNCGWALYKAGIGLDSAALDLSLKLYMRFVFLSLALAGFSLPAFSASLVVNGDFSAKNESGYPKDWEIKGDLSSVSLPEEAGNSFLRIQTKDLAYCSAVQRFPVGADWNGLAVKARIRMKNLKKGPSDGNTATLLYVFEDAEGQHVGDWSQHMLAADQDWTQVTDQVTKIPPGASALLVMCGFMNAAGTVDFDDIEVSPIIGQAKAAEEPKVPGQPKAAADDRGNLIQNGDFQRAGELAGWEVSGDARYASVQKEGDNQFLRLKLDSPGFLNVLQRFPVGKDWKNLNVTFRCRASGLKKGPEAHNTATVLYSFEDAENQHVGDWSQTMIQADQDWTAMTGRVETIPAGATTLLVQCGLMNASGTIDFDDIVVVPGLAGGMPPGVKMSGDEPVEDLGYSRGRICLNGVWRFQPAQGELKADGWGLIRVPGTWNGLANFPGIIDRGAGTNWQGFDGSKLEKAWYERKIQVPSAWQGRKILLDLRRVSTDAVVEVDGKRCGEIQWPEGTVDVTSAVTAGSEHTLRILVSAVQDSKQRLNAMGVGQNTMVEARLLTRGIIGETFLVSQPAGARLDSVWVRTSVRDQELSVDADLVEAPKSGQVTFDAEIQDAQGKVVKKFSGSVPVTAGNSTVTMKWPWKDPLLWDLAQPNLYTLNLSANGEGWKGGFRQTFGFREFWIEGRQMFLNGTPFRLRPTSSIPEGEYSVNNGSVAVLTSAMEDILKAGFNCVELWPTDYTERGSFNFHELVCELADRKGLPLMGPVRHAAKLFNSWTGMRWEDPQARADWEVLLRRDWLKYRNNPSIILWSSTGNIGGHIDDQDPRKVGNSLKQAIWQPERKTAGWWHFMNRLNEMIAVVKEMDPTRPVMIHQGGPVSDIYGINNYLELTPLQEREEWLSDWSQKGDMPFCSVEFGTPLSTTMNRGRDGFVFSSTTEWLMTEHCAAYLGKEAYRLEEGPYRSAISGPKYKGGQLWDWPDQGILDYAPAFQQLERLFITNTWRSWRTMGVTGGMIAWGDGHGFKPSSEETALPPFVQGQRGAWYPSMKKQPFTPFGPPGVEIMPGGTALRANNGPTLAWICGPAKEGDVAAFTSKDHSYLAGESIAKQVALLNDTRDTQNWKTSVRFSVGGKSVKVLESSGTLAVGETAFVPVEAQLPSSSGDKVEGEIVLEAEIGNQRHTDRFAFRLFSPSPALEGEILVFDPRGETIQWLRNLGLKVKIWNGEATKVLVVGRSALSDGATPPGNLEVFVRQGGRLLVMAQDPSWLTENVGFRACALMTRRVFTLDPTHAVVRGLDDEDLRDWNGASTLREPKPDYTRSEVSRNIMPTWGWRWGGRGAVSSVAIEKPHRAGWRPLVECEFDLAYSPLMELNLGTGRVTLCTFDLEDHVAVDPAAKLLARNIVDWVRSAPLGTAPGTSLYVGNEQGADLLELLGCDYSRTAPNASLVILGPDVSSDVADEQLASGKTVLCLPRKQPVLGLAVSENPAFGGSSEVPAWPEARGLSASDLRWRCDGAAYLLSGANVSAGGVLARIEKGAGKAILCQSDPLTLPADQLAYFRYTRWRQTRTLTQLIANLGGAFTLDDRLFHPKNGCVPLNGPWKAAWTRAIPSGSSPTPDPGPSGAALALLETNADESNMQEVVLPGFWSAMEHQDGEAVFRKRFTLPADWQGRDMIVHLGAIDDFDETRVNGTKIGAIGVETKACWTVQRDYKVPARLLKPGENEIAVRIFDNFGGGGFAGASGRMEIAPDAAPMASLYHPDYRSDFPLGDNPYRYYRW